MSDKILIVDDDKTTITMIQAGLEKKGYIVVSAQNGEEGLKQAGQSQPDLVILDIEMPKMNGYNFLHDFRKMDGFKDTPVIILTSHKEMKPIFELKGIDKYLTKPIRFEDLHKNVTDVLED